MIVTHLMVLGMTDFILVSSTHPTQDRFQVSPRLRIGQDRALERTHVLSCDQSDDDRGSEDEGLSLFLKRDIPAATEDFDTHETLTELWESRQIVK
jgi:hypothetical protein